MSLPDLPTFSNIPDSGTGTLPKSGYLRSGFPPTEGSTVKTVSAVSRVPTRESPDLQIRGPDGYLLQADGPFPPDSTWIYIFGLIIGIIFIILIIIIIFAIFIDESVDFPDLQTLVVENEINDTTGSSSDGVVNLRNGSAYQDAASCNLGPTREWTNGQSISFNTCDCLPPFFGPSCFRESYIDTYTAIGNPNPNNIIATGGQPTVVDRLSFPFMQNPGRIATDPMVNPIESERICTQMCDQNNDCVGVLWAAANPPNFGINQSSDNSDQSANKPECQLLLDQVVVRPGENIPYSPTTDSTLYMKMETRPQFKDRVFVFQGERPIRYWLADTYTSPFGDNRSQTMFNRQIIQFNWTPQTVINDTGCHNTTDPNCNFGQGWYGFFSNRSINLTNNQLLTQLIMEAGGTITIDGQEYVIIRPGTETLMFPSSWTELWGAFVDPATIPGLNLNLNPSNISISVPTTNLDDNLNIRPPGHQVNPIGLTGTFNSNYRTEISAEMFSSRIYRRSHHLTVNGSPSIRTHLDVRRSKHPVSESNSTSHRVNWSQMSFPSDGHGKIIHLRRGDNIRLVSHDQDYHDVVSTDSEWNITRQPINIGVSKSLDVIIPFRNVGTFFLKDRIHPQIIRLTAMVQENYF